MGIGSTTIIINNIHCMIDGDTWGHPHVGFDLSHPGTAQAIRDRDPKILDALVYLLHHEHFIRDLPQVSHGLSNGWEYMIRGSSEIWNNYQESLVQVQDNPFASSRLKSRALQELQKIEDWRNSQKRKQIQTKAKQKLTRLRRAQFADRRPELMLALIERNGYECAICQSQDDLTVDHIIPVSKGGTDGLENLQLLCRKHNSKKNDKMPQGSTNDQG